MEWVEDASCWRQVGTAQQATWHARPPVNVLAAIGAAPVAFEALFGGEKDDLVAFLAKGLLVPSFALATATMMAYLVDVARVALYPLGFAVREHDGTT
jgi:hypothetical protein